ncbi:MAG TPA: glutathione transferase GstA, partial [Flavobacteriales bacterium]|nr:glutathione transferase GstA [Flavobacteriales bacterium]
ELKLAPAAGTIERYRLQEWLSFLSTELHKGFAPLFNPTATDAFKETVVEKLKRRFGWMDRQLEGRDFLMGSQFTVADAYGFTVASWTDRMKIDRSSMSHLGDYVERVAARPCVETAMRAEGLLD